jgi:hypothetical protein
MAQKLTPTEMVIKELGRFLVDGKPEVICVKGRWGVGKTYAWKKALQEAAAGGKMVLSTYSYVSLFGVTTLEQLKYSIFENRTSGKAIATGANLESVSVGFSDIIKTVGPKALEALGGKTLAEMAQSSTFLMVRDQIICIDDIERKGKDLRAIDILGLVSMLAEQRNCKRSLFSDVVLRGLSLGSPIADLSGKVDLETTLLPYLREQVPLEAAARKGGQAQEPVSGGWMAQPLKLVTVEGRSLGRALTTVEIIRSGIRRALIGSAIGVVTCFVVLEALVIHLAVSTTGAVVVRPGLNSTFGIIPFHFSAQIDSGMRLSDLDPANADVFLALASGTIRGIRTHLDNQGLKTWLADIKPGLRSVRRKSVTVLAQGETAKFVPDEDPAPLEEVAFLATLRDEPIADLAYELYNRSFTVVDSCTDAIASISPFSWAPATCSRVTCDGWPQRQPTTRNDERSAYIIWSDSRLTELRIHRHDKRDL